MGGRVQINRDKILSTPKTFVIYAMSWKFLLSKDIWTFLHLNVYSWEENLNVFKGNKELARNILTNFISYI